MTGTKNFVLGFIISLFSVVSIGQLHHPAYLNSTRKASSDVHLDLFKKTDTSYHSFMRNDIFAHIEKQSLKSVSFTESIGNIVSPDGIEDDEILSIALDDDIPIEFSNNVSNEQIVESMSEDNDDTVAMLPSDLRADETFDNNNPWVTVKGSPYIKNKRLLSELNQNASDNLLSAQNSVIADDNLSYKVAEKIKQSIIFPIPDDILNDENLTPTFIHPKNAPPSTQPKKQKNTNSPKKQESVLQVIKKENKSADTATSGEAIIDQISTQLTEESPSVNNNNQQASSQKKKPAPLYSSPNNNIPGSKNIHETTDLGNLYESIQQVRNEHIQHDIASFELKLSFQPGRAEISGKTLHWLKLFSEAALQNNIYLQVRLDGSVDTELQKKRLNLLYTIFMNNGVDFKKIDTVFSLTEPNAFIIRTRKSK